jgi:hypothetical protein
LDQYLSPKVQSGSSSGRITLGDKVRTYLNAFISPLSSENPIDDLKDDFCRKIFNGSEQLPLKHASFIKANIDFVTFETFCDDLSIDARMGMISQFASSNFDIDIDNFEQGITGVLDTILYYIINVPPSTSIRSSTFLGGNKVLIGGKTVDLLPELMPTDKIELSEVPYIDALLRVYSQSEKHGPISIDDLKTMHPRYTKHFKVQRENYFSAESVLHQIRDIYVDGELEFNNAKNEALSGIETTILEVCKNALERVDNTMKHVTVVSFSKSYLMRDNNGLIGPKEKQGMVHMLVNDGKIEWVVDYDTDI